MWQSLIFQSIFRGAVKKYSVSTSNLEIEDLSDLKLITDPGLRELSDKFREAEKMISDFSYIFRFFSWCWHRLGY